MVSARHPQTLARQRPPKLGPESQRAAARAPAMAAGGELGRCPEALPQEPGPGASGEVATGCRLGLSPETREPPIATIRVGRRLSVFQDEWRSANEASSFECMMSFLSHILPWFRDPR